MLDTRRVAVVTMAVSLAVLAAGCIYIRLPVTQPQPAPTPTPVATTWLMRVTPWALTNGLVGALAPGDTLAVTYDTLAPSSGSLLPLRIDGTGSATFSFGSKYGANSDVCAEGAACSEAACPGLFPDVCSETAPECDGPACGVETGNLLAYFREAIDYRLANAGLACDEWDEAVGASGDGYAVRDECNPVLSGNLDSRVLVLPLVDTLCTPVCSVTIKDFATFWLEGYNPAACAGSACEVNLRLVSPSPAW